MSSAAMAQSAALRSVIQSADSLQAGLLWASVFASVTDGETGVSKELGSL